MLPAGTLRGKGAGSVHAKDEQSGQPAWQGRLKNAMCLWDLCHWTLMMHQP